MKSLTCNTVKRRKHTFLITLMLVLPLAFTQVALASSYTSWLDPFETFINTMFEFLSIIGKGLLMWAVFEIATSLFSHDTSQMPQALRRIGGGALLVFVQPLVNAMTSTTA